MVLTGSSDIKDKVHSVLGLRDLSTAAWMQTEAAGASRSNQS